MRVRVIGTSISASAIRASLHAAGIAVSDEGYGYTIQIVETEQPWPTIDGIDCELERRIINRISDCANIPVILLRPGGVRSDHAICIGIPKDADAPSIERGVMQAIVQLLIPQRQPKMSMWKKARRWLATAIYAGCFLMSAQIIPKWPIIAGYTVSTLPSAGVKGRVAFVTDAASTASCTVGGGSTVVFCRDSGTAWSPAGDGGGGGGGSGTVTSVSVTTANGVSGSVATATTTPAITLTLGAITPTSVAAVGSVTGSNLSGTNTGDQTSVSGNAGTATALQTPRNINGVAFDGTAPITITANLPADPAACIAGQYVTDQDAAGTLTCAQVAYSQVSGTPTLATIATSGSASDLSAGTVAAARFPALTGDVTTTAGTVSTTVGKINGTSLAGLATGLLKNTTTTGVPSIAVAGTDYVTPAGNVATATALASAPTNCSANQPAQGITTSGAANCMSLSASVAKSASGVLSAATTADVSGIGYVTGGGTAQAQTATLSPALAAMAAGVQVCWLPIAANTAAAPTLAVNGLTATTITKYGTTALVANDIVTTAVACVIHDGTRWQLQNPQTNNGTVTSVGFTGGLISVGTSTTTPALTVAGTSGGVVYFSAASTWASSGALAANTVVLGGGAGAAPTTAGGFTISTAGSAGGTNFNQGTSTALARQDHQHVPAAVTSVTGVTVNTNVTTDQNLISLSLPAGVLNAVNRHAMFRASGVYTTQAAQTPTITWKVKLCTVSGCATGTALTLGSWTTAATTASATNMPWNVNCAIAGVSTGATGTVELHGQAVTTLGTTPGAASEIRLDTNTAASSTIDLTAALFLQMTATFSTNAATANTATQRHAQFSFVNN